MQTHTDMLIFPVKNMADFWRQAKPRSQQTSAYLVVLHTDFLFSGYQVDAPVQLGEHGSGCTIILSVTWQSCHWGYFEALLPGL